MRYIKINNRDNKRFVQCQEFFSLSDISPYFPRNKKFPRFTYEAARPFSIIDKFSFDSFSNYILIAYFSFYIFSF